MRLLFCFSFLIISTVTFSQKKYVMVIHGGAGTIVKENMSAQSEKEYKSKLEEALQKGYSALQKGQSSVDAVAAAITVLEDSPLFNAGKGAVFTHDGKNELDASIMNGSNRKAGAVAGVHTIKNPILAAIAVMNNSEHVMMTGEGAEKFAKENGLQIVNPSYFKTEKSWNALQKILESEKKKKTSLSVMPADAKFGTVGAVAIDIKGNIAAGTSTGGMTNKKFGRVGDSPIIGAGTYANNQVGISCTGWGEYYIRSVAAFNVAAKMQYQQKNIIDAAKEVIKEIEEMGGDGGMIALDKNGNISMPFNTSGMYRGAITDKGEIEVYIFK